MLENLDDKGSFVLNGDLNAHKQDWLGTGPLQIVMNQVLDFAILAYLSLDIGEQAYIAGNCFH